MRAQSSGSPEADNRRRRDRDDSRTSPGRRGSGTTIVKPPSPRATSVSSQYIVLSAYQRARSAPGSSVPRLRSRASGHRPRVERPPGGGGARLTVGGAAPRLAPRDPSVRTRPPACGGACGRVPSGPPGCGGGCGTVLTPLPGCGGGSGTRPERLSAVRRRARTRSAGLAVRRRTRADGSAGTAVRRRPAQNARHTAAGTRRRPSDARRCPPSPRTDARDALSRARARRRPPRISPPRPPRPPPRPSSSSSAER